MAELKAALLTSGDLGGGYTAQDPGSAGLGDNSLSGCPTLTNDPPGVVTSVGTLLTESSTNTYVGNTLQQMAPGTAAAAMNAYAALPTACATFTGDVDGTSITFHTARLAFPSVGDRTVAVVVSFDLGVLGTVTEDIVIVQHGDTLIGVVNQGLPTNESLTQRAANAAYAKVSSRW